MKIVLGLLVASFIYNLLLMVIYFSKARINNEENNIYSVLLSINLVGIALEFFCMLFASQMTEVGEKIKESMHVVIFARAYLIYLLTWVFIYMRYVYNISINTKRKIYAYVENNKKRVRKIFWSIYLIFLICEITLPMYFYNTGASAYTDGPAIKVLMVLFTVGVIFSIGNMVLSYKRSRLKKYLPVFSFYICVSLVVITKLIDPAIQLVSTILTFTTVLMYFVIENPDLKMVKELEDNRNLIEKNYESNANFLFNVSQEVKNPISKIDTYYENSKNTNDSKDLKDILDKIKEESNNLNFIVSNFLDISTLDSHDIKLTNNTYNLKNLIRKVEIITKENLSDKVQFRCNISATTPEYLYGDDLKIKQILNTIIGNSVKYTKEGFIELTVDSIVKYDACRVVFVIEDSGKGMSLNKTNELMEETNELTEKDLKLLDNPVLNIGIVKKIVKLIGGHIMIKSEVGKGTKFMITLEQRLPKKDSEELDVTQNHFKSSSKRILVISDRKDEILNIKEILKKEKVVVTSSMFEKDALEKVKNNLYDLILIEDNFGNSSGLSIFKKIKDENIDIPSVIMLSEGKLTIRDSYLEDGFIDTLNKNNMSKELLSILDKYIN